jgi:DNA-binding transcriptional LysR family regulator
MHFLHQDRPMNLFWLRDLAHLAATGNFSRAAQVSNLSQPALSRRIKAIEGWVGVALVDRTRHPVRLTGAGIQILEAGQHALNALDDERKGILEAQSRADRYVVKFAAQHSLGWRFYPVWLQAFESAFGPIVSRLRADDLPACLQDLEAGAVDFVIAYESRRGAVVTTSREIESVRIGGDSLLPVAKAGPDGRPLHSLDRKGNGLIPYLQFGPSAPISRHIEPLLDSGELRTRLHVVYENSMAGALRIRVRDGMGLAWLPKSLLAPDIDAGLVAPAGGTRWHIPLDIRLYRIRRQANSLTEKIWSFLASREDLPLILADKPPFPPTTAKPRRKGKDHVVGDPA